MLQEIGQGEGEMTVWLLSSMPFGHHTQVAAHRVQDDEPHRVPSEGVLCLFCPHCKDKRW